MNSYDDVRFYITGFSSFPGVDKNPTEQFILNLDQIVMLAGTDLDIPFKAVVEVSGVGALQTLTQIQQYRLCKALNEESYDENEENENNNNDNDKNKRICNLYLHFGVGGSKFKLEKIGYNNSIFGNRGDVRLWAPNNQPVYAMKRQTNDYLSNDIEMDIKNQIETKIDVQSIVDNNKDVFEEFEDLFETSIDPGRYVCNWIYYSSLTLTDKIDDDYSLFVHVPHQNTVNLDFQYLFVSKLLVTLKNYFIKSDE
eukprot:TRINITY_DN14382_c0_g1_i1.p1 TRINITY_DN14382_c0_g1~~TRINITY_DN14382_c0_g1_i1.p1  ORF type:complete len:254 (+),score=66.98 TRINITY_DN14382_c0_g1_i1:30-791(+)